MKVVKVPMWLRQSGCVSPNALSGWPNGVRYTGEDYKRKRKHKKQEEKKTEYEQSLVAIVLGESLALS